jgi:hypothetical protein
MGFGDFFIKILPSSSLFSDGPSNRKGLLEGERVGVKKVSPPKRKGGKRDVPRNRDPEGERSSLLPPTC